MLNNIKDLLAQKKKELNQNSYTCVTTDFEEVEQDAKGLELHKIVIELTELVGVLEADNAIEINIKDFDGKTLKKDSIIQLLDDDGEPYTDNETSPIRLVLEDDRFSIRAFEKNHAYTSIGGDTYSPYFRIVEAV